MNKKTFIHSFNCLIFTMLMGGCSPVNYKANLQHADLCCSNFADIKYIQLGYEEPIEMKIGEDQSPARIFGNQKSFFMAVQLPPHSGPYELQIESIPVNQSLFLPECLLLDDNYQVKNKIAFNEFENSNGHASHHFFINQDTGFRYLILYSTNLALGKKSQIRQTGVVTVPILVGPLIVNYSSGTDVKNSVISSEGGQVLVRAKKYLLTTVKP